MSRLFFCQKFTYVLSVAGKRDFPGNVYFYDKLGSMQWATAIQLFDRYLRLERAASQNTRDAYVRDVEKLAQFAAEHGWSPENIPAEGVQRFVYDISKILQARTQSRIISGLRAFFDYMVLDNYRKDNPAAKVESPKTGRKIPEVLSVEEIDRMIEAIDLSHPQGERNRAIIETLYGCGLRVSELVGLRISDLFPDEGFIRVIGKGDKQRFVPLNAQNMKYIRLYVEQVRSKQKIQKGYEDILFLNRRGRQMTRHMVYHIIKELAGIAGIRKNISPHTFRHSFATHLLENGAGLRAIQEMLGHESITTTEIYMHLDKKHLGEVVRKYHPRSFY